MATIYWRGASAYLQWTGADGRQNRRSVGKLDRQAAEAIRAAKEAEVRYGVKIIGGARSLGAYVENEYLPRIAAGKQSARPTAKFALAPVLERFGECSMDALDPREFRSYITERMDNARSATVNKEIRMVKAALNAAVADRVITSNPLATLKPPRVIASAKPIRFYDRAQLDAIYESAGDRRWLWQFMVNTGLRRGELAKARREDVTQARGMFALVVASEDDDDETVNRRTKSAKLRNVPLNAAAQLALSQLGRVRLVDLTPGGISKAWEATRDGAGVTGGVHTLRHTFISHLVMGGVPIRTVQVLAGHSSIAMTERYAHLAPGAESDAVNRIAL